jgi:hypothetical protein
MAGSYLKSKEKNLLPYRKVTIADRWLWKNEDTLPSGTQQTPLAP